MAFFACCRPSVSRNFEITLGKISRAVLNIISINIAFNAEKLDFHGVPGDAVSYGWFEGITIE
jgi:hypothetical protein